MTKKQTTTQNDLMSEIDALRDQIHDAAEAAGLARYLMNHGAMTVSPHPGRRFIAADISVRFQPNHGLEHELTTLVTSPGRFCAIDTHAKRQRIADLFVRHMASLRNRAAQTALMRQKIKLAALEVLGEANREGFGLELMRIQLAPCHVYGEPGARGDFRQVFYVHLMMPHVDEGVMTEDVFTIDADEPDDLARYLRDRTLPELRDERDGITESVAA